MVGKTDLIPIIGTENPNRKADIIFVHGLGGDAWSTWHPSAKKDDNNFWLMWLGEDFKDCGIWSVNYEVEPTKWRGSTMFLRDRATNIVDLLEVNKLGTRPIIFITHSMGGLVIKQMLCNATYSQESSWKRIVKQTHGIVFLSTPHSGSNIANWFKYIGGILGATVSIGELEKNKPDLINLNAQYCNHELLSKIPILVYSEGQKTKLTFFVKAIVVDKESANPGSKIEDIKFVQLDEDHISISKPNSKGHQLYKGVKQFIEKCLSNYTENMDCEGKDFQVNDRASQASNSEFDQGTRHIYINQGDYIQKRTNQTVNQSSSANNLREEILEVETSSTANTRREFYSKRLAAKQEELAAIEAQLAGTLTNKDEVKLNRDAENLLAEIETLETKLNHL